MTMQEKSRRLAIIEEMLQITDNMLSHRDEPDTLMLGVEDRQMLIDEFDLLNAEEEPLSTEENSEVRRIVKMILEKDVLVNDALKSHRDETRKEMAENTRQQEILKFKARHNPVTAPGTFLNSKM